MIAVTLGSIARLWRRRSSSTSQTQAVKSVQPDLAQRAAVLGADPEFQTWAQQVRAEASRSGPVDSLLGRDALMRRRDAAIRHSA
jgi:hypothetical protein